MPDQDQTTTNTSVPEQPDGIADDSHDLPDVARAAERVDRFLQAYGDGLVGVLVSPEYQDAMPPLYARDLEALSRAATAQAPVGEQRSMPPDLVRPTGRAMHPENEDWCDHNEVESRCPQCRPDPTGAPDQDDETRVAVAALRQAAEAAAVNVRIAIDTGLDKATLRHWRATRGWLRRRAKQIEQGVEPDRPAADRPYAHQDEPPRWTRTERPPATKTDTDRARKLVDQHAAEHGALNTYEESVPRGQCAPEAFDALRAALGLDDEVDRRIAAALLKAEADRA